ncbi:MAG: ACT domain-containing protein [Thermoplasmata archaeon]
MSTAFRVTLKDAPGALAHVAGALAERGINLEASGGETVGGEGRVTLLTSDEGATREVLEGHNIAFEEVELLVVTLQDNPGALASIAQRLAAAGVNITSLVQLNRLHGRSDLGIAVDDLKKARSVLGED